MGRYRDFDPISDTPCASGLGLDIGVLDEGSFERSLGRDFTLFEPGIRVSALDQTPDKDVVQLIGMEERSTWGESRIDPEEWLERLPLDGYVFVTNRDNRLTVTDQCGHRFAAKTYFAVGEDRLVFDMRIDSESVVPRNVRGRHDLRQAWILSVE